MKEITLKWLEKQKACQSCIDWFLGQKETNTAKIMLKLVKEERNADALWIFEQLANKKQAVALAVFSARLVLKNYEAENTDTAPRKAVEAAEAYLKRPCAETIQAARKAAKASWEAARSAALAAAPVAALAALAAATSVAGSAAEKSLQLKIIRHAIKILHLEV